MVGLTPYSVIVSYGNECIFLGMNAVLYGFCAYTLWGQKSLSCRVLFFIITAQFLLCTLQIFCHGVLFFLIFTVIPDKLGVYFTHFNVYVVTHSIIYNINYAFGGILSIWRLYVLYDSNAWVCIPAFIIWMGQLGTSGKVIRDCTTVPVLYSDFNVASLVLWVLILTLNLCVAIPICLRLCAVQERTHTTLSDSPYKSMAIIFVECGTLITICSVGMVLLYALKFSYALAALGVATEVVVASQLLITARHAMLSQDRDATGPYPPALEINIAPTESKSVDTPVSPMKKQSLSDHSAAESSEQHTSMSLDDV